MSMNFTKTAAAVGAMLLVTACGSSSDSVFGGGGGGGGSSPASVTALGVTGEGGVTEKVGLSALTDPLLGTEGVLGGGDEGLIGGQVPAELTEGLAPIADGLSPVVGAVEENLPLGMVTGQLPALGVSGEGGLGEDLLGQDLTGMLLGETGAIPGLLAGGNDGPLGSAIPEGAVPGLPGGDGGDPLAPVTDLVGGLLGGGLPGLPGGDGGDPLAPVTDLVGGLVGGGLPALPGTE